MPDEARRRNAIWWVFWAVTGILIVQIIYPPTHTMPLAYWQGQHHGYSSEIILAANIAKEFDDTIVRLKAGDKSVDVRIGALGAEPQVGSVLEELTDYPFWQRYVPLSILWPRFVETTTLTYANPIAQAECKARADELSHSAVNASVQLEDGQLIANDDASGLQVDADELCRQIQELPTRLGDVVDVNVEGKVIAAEQTSDDFAAVAQQARAALGHTVTLTYEQKIYAPEPTEQASWLRLDSDDTGQTILVVNDDAVREYLANISKQIGRPAGKTNVSIVDGVEKSRQVGESGQEINYEPAISEVRGQLLGQAMVQPIELNLRDVAPTIIYNNQYTATQEGLQAYVSDAARKYNAHISIQQLDGAGWRAAAREHESIPSASTYKLYVAMKLFDEMKAGKVSWSDSILDTNVSVCFDRMTIASTNQCSEEWLRRFGRQEVNQYLYDNGFSKGTTFTHPVASHTTAADLTNYMVRLARGELFDDVYKQRLLASLGNHPFPYGIPAGSTGRVHDKVGFLWDYVHDAAIVDHLRGRYAMTIMTKGQSYARIAEITREVERIMYP